MDELERALRLILAVAKTIREAGEVSAGRVFASFSHAMDMSRFAHILDTLDRHGAIVRQGDLLVWSGR